LPPQPLARHHPTRAENPERPPSRRRIQGTNDCAGAGAPRPRFALVQPGAEDGPLPPSSAPPPVIPASGKMAGPCGLRGSRRARHVLIRPLPQRPGDSFRHRYKCRSATEHSASRNFDRETLLGPDRGNSMRTRTAQSSGSLRPHCRFKQLAAARRVRRSPRGQQVRRTRQCSRRR
jgi:hypothetical protein